MADSRGVEDEEAMLEVVAVEEEAVTATGEEEVEVTVSAARMTVLVAQMTDSVGQMTGSVEE